MKEIRLVIFDLDGTLINAYESIARSFNHTMLKLGYPPQRNIIIRRAVGWGDKDLLKPFIKAKDLNKALLIYRKHHKGSLVRHSYVFPGVHGVLKHLKERGYLLAVASNRPTRFSKILVNHLKLKRYFNYLLCADKLKSGKPHPEILNKIMRKFSVKPSEAVYVGDMAIDAQAGRRAKVRTVIVTTGSSTKKEIKAEKPRLVIGRIPDLLKVLCRV